MKEFFENLWKVAPQTMSVVVIIGILFFGALKVSQLYLAFESMNARLTKVEDRLDRLEQKVDLIIEYLLEDRAKQKGK